MIIQEQGSFYDTNPNFMQDVFRNIHQNSPIHLLSCAFSPKKLVPTVDGRNPANQLGYIKPCKQWDIYHINWLAGFLPSTVGILISWLIKLSLYNWYNPYISGIIPIKMWS